MVKIINDTDEEENPITDNRCPLCRKKTHGGIFCSMSHYRIFLHTPKKFKDRKAIKESLEYFKPYETCVITPSVSQVNVSSQSQSDEDKNNFSIKDTTPIEDRGILSNLKRHMDFIARRIHENSSVENKTYPVE